MSRRPLDALGSCLRAGGHETWPLQDRTPPAYFAKAISGELTGAGSRRFRMRLALS